jgi:hypothetical protein
MSFARPELSRFWSRRDERGGAGRGLALIREGRSG